MGQNSDLKIKSEFLTPMMSGFKLLIAAEKLK